MGGNFYGKDENLSGAFEKTMAGRVMLGFIITSTNKKPDEVQRIVNAEFKAGMKATVDSGEKIIAAKTPRGATGRARKSIAGKVINPFTGEITGEGSGKKYLDFVERGRGSGKAPPRAPIELWLRRTAKGRAFVARVRARYNIQSERAALAQAIYLKQRGIARRGTPGAFMFKESLRSVAAAADKHLSEAIKKIEIKLSD